MAMEENEEIKKAIEELEKLSLDPNEKELYEYRERALRDYISEMDYSINKGRAEGLEEGMKKGIKQGNEEGKKEAQIEIAKKMLIKGIDVETIREVTGLTKEEII